MARRKVTNKECDRVAKLIGDEIRVGPVRVRQARSFVALLGRHFDRGRSVLSWVIARGGCL
jgi:hypothetical protein